MMRSPGISVGFLLLLLLLVATAQGIAVRLEGESLAASRKKLQEEDRTRSRRGKPVEGAVFCNKGQASGTREKRRATAAIKAHHRFPEFHEDYYGPRNHNPKHH